MAEEEKEATVLPADEQVAMKALCAADVEFPLHMLAICCWTLVASEPQMVLRSAGFGSVLIAANRHAGGTATT